MRPSNIFEHACHIMLPDSVLKEI